MNNGRGVLPTRRLPHIFGALEKGGALNHRRYCSRSFKSHRVRMEPLRYCGVVIG
jgi:hypothetical protein